jgi:stage II sporulation protein E
MAEALARFGEKLSVKLETIKPELVWLGWAAFGFLAGRAELLEGLKPFGSAYIAACGAMGFPAFPALIGVCLGIMSKGFNILNAYVLVPPLLIYFSLFAMRRAGRSLNLGWGGLLLIAARLVYLPMRPLLLYYVLQFAIETGVALTAYYAFCTAASAFDHDKPLTAAGPLVCMAVCAGIFLAGLPGGAWFSIRHFTAILLTLAVAAVGGAAPGAAGGLAIGLVIALSGSNEILFSGSLGVCGLLCGVFKPLKRFGMAGGFCLGAVLMSAWATNLSQAAVPWKEMLLAVAIFLAIPSKVWEWLELRLNHGNTNDDGARELKMAKMRETVVTKMLDFSKCLDKLSEVFEETANSGGDNWEDVAPLLEAVAAEVCQKCSKRERCWQNEFYTTYGQFLKAMAAPGKRKVLLESDFPEEFRQNCRQFAEVVASLKNAWGLYRVKSGYRRRIDESRALAGKQLKGVSEVMEKLAAQFSLQIRANEDMVQLVREALRESGAQCRSVSVQDGKAFGLTVKLTVKPCGGRRKCRGYEETLSTALGRPMRRTCTACSPSETTCHLEFTQARAMRVTCAGSQRPKEGTVCGDACIWDSLDDGSYFMAISDGMGTGTRAAMESQATLSLLQRFYQAGFSENVIYDTINQVMLLRSSGETFSTVDLCMLNLIDGEANFIKIGAPPTFLIRRGQVLQVASPTLPLGILDEISPGATKRILEDGDVIVMVSDGITANEDTDWLEAELLNMGDCEPHQMAAKLLEYAEMRYGKADDMTVVVARVRLPRTVTYAEKHTHKKLVRWKARVAGSGD